MEEVVLPRTVAAEEEGVSESLRTVLKVFLVSGFR
jgi:hypothetical protein